MFNLYYLGFRLIIHTIIHEEGFKVSQQQYTHLRQSLNLTLLTYAIKLAVSSFDLNLVQCSNIVTNNVHSLAQSIPILSYVNQPFLFNLKIPCNQPYKVFKFP